MPGLDELMARDEQRMALIKQAVAQVRDMVEDYSNDPLEFKYLVYKIGGRLLFEVLEDIDKQILSNDLLAVGGGSMPPFPGTPAAKF